MASSLAVMSLYRLLIRGGGRKCLVSSPHPSCVDAGRVAVKIRMQPAQFIFTHAFILVHSL